MAVKECGSHESNSPPVFKFIRRYIVCLIFIIVTFLGILLAWAILHTSNPRFVLQDTTIFSFNVSGNPPNLLTSKFQITLLSRNPNDKAGIYYDRLNVFASYESQQITFPTSIPSTYQGHQETNVWSPFIGGNSVPVAPYNALSLDNKHTRGGVKLVFQIDGRVRYKVGPFTSWKYHLYVRCPAYINVENSAAGFNDGGKGVKYTLTTTCNVSA